MPDLRIDADGVTLAGTEDGEGVPVVLLHGLTATRRYVVMGSKALPRSGHRVVGYDARGHGTSTPPTERAAYRYDLLMDDLVAVLDDRGLERAVFAGASMGAHTIARLALEHPGRVAGAVFVTPAYDGELDDPAGWDRLADGLERGGIEGFVEAYDLGRMPEDWHGTVLTVLRQRLSQHEHLDAVADALRAVPRSRPFDALADLGDVACPAVVVADRDEADPGHPLAIGEAWARALPDAELLVEEEGRSPIAWQGGQLSKVVAGLAARVTA
jgi:pimeloyl-ACP methyl ester carboxylesterase